MVYAFKVSLLVLTISLPLSYLLDYIFPNAETPDFEISIHTFWGAVIIAPIIETILMIPIILILQKYIHNIVTLSILSAIFWGGIHSLQFTFWGIAIFPLFFFMTMAYKYWDKISMGHAILVVMVIHAINNGTAMLLAATLESL
ncbi:hypothetical protein NBRC116592_15240 [Colwellia sp. KU-HH00111]